MSIIEAIILGIVQGLTEFLPISSSGHIELGKAILGVESADDITFTLLVHAATALSILVVFWKDIKELFFSIFSFQWNENTQYIAKIALSMLPAAFVGLFFEDQLNELFDGEIILVGCCLIATGFILFLTQLERKHRRSVNFLDAIIIGLAQAVAILPGISRSGSTISTALALGIEKEKATRFSFLMVLGLIAGASAAVNRLFDQDKSQSSGYYVGSENAEPAQIDGPPNQSPVNQFGVQQQTIVYGPQELGILYEIKAHYTRPTMAQEQQERLLQKATRYQADYLIFTLDTEQHSNLISRILSAGMSKLILQNITTPVAEWQHTPPFLYVGFDHAKGSETLSQYFKTKTNNQGEYGVVLCCRSAM